MFFFIFCLLMDGADSGTHKNKLLIRIRKTGGNCNLKVKVSRSKKKKTPCIPGRWGVAGGGGPPPPPSQISPCRIWGVSPAAHSQADQQQHQVLQQDQIILKPRVGNLSPARGRGIDSRNRVWNWAAMLHKLAGRYDNPTPTWFLAPIAGLELPTQYSCYKLQYLRVRVGFSSLLITENTGH